MQRFNCLQIIRFPTKLIIIPAKKQICEQIFIGDAMTRRSDRNGVFKRKYVGGSVAGVTGSGMQIPANSGWLLLFIGKVWIGFAHGRPCSDCNCAGKLFPGVELQRSARSRQFHLPTLLR